MKVTRHEHIYRTDSDEQEVWVVEDGQYVHEGDVTPDEYDLDDIRDDMGDLTDAELQAHAVVRAVTRDRHVIELISVCGDGLRVYASPATYWSTICGPLDEVTEDVMWEISGAPELLNRVGDMLQAVVGK